ncbi:MAG TPA: sulfatase-like hydrolase/transferase, partial [Steroidobacter sp.]|nr:sulfatase-like hydrolase/transferase [Steroidobacter sp.]
MTGNSLLKQVGAALAIGAALWAQTSSAAQSADERPNFLIIMADDLGYSDVGAYGGEIDTPNIDRLASGGLQFTNFYNSARCSPSRANLLTGRYAHRVGMGENGGSMSVDVRTVAEEFKDAQYRTAMVGKWHLTRATPIADPKEHLKWINHQAYRDRDFGDRSTYPAARGFQTHFGLVWGVSSYFDPFSLVEGFEPVRTVPKDFYLTDALSDRAVRDIESFAKEERPFFMYLAYTAPHWPLHAPEQAIAKYRGRYDGGWEKLHAERYAKLVKLGLVNPSTTPKTQLSGDWAVNPEKPWDQLSQAERAQAAAKMSVHAAMIDVMDQGIGRVIEALKRTGQYENTVIVFLADNGASPETMSGTRGYQPGYDRQSETRDGRKIQYGAEQPTLGSDTSMAGIGAFWANVANTPWRYWKAEAYDGGVHTPFIVSWPKGLKLKPGTRVDSLGHIMDIAPTFYELAGVQPQTEGQP